MSEPIINPWAFYLISLCDKVSWVSTAVALVLVALAVLLTIGMVTDGDPDDKSLRKMVVILYAVVGVSALLALFVPSSETAIAMLVAKNVTPETIRLAGKTATESVEIITKTILQAVQEG